MPDPSVMAEVTRLTRAGRLIEAMALLRGGGADAREHPKGAWPSGGKGFKRPRARAGSNRHAPRVPDGADWTRGTHGCAEGARDYALYVPSSLAPEPALLVMLHGCTQDAGDFAVGTRMNALAERHGFLALYPEQSRSDNPNGCWNWFEPGHRHGGEAVILRGMAEAVARKHGARRRCVAGLSAGGAMAANLCALGDWGGVMVHSGLPAGAASGLPDALRAMRSGGAGADTALGAPALIVHGDADRTVSPANADALAAQATANAEAAVQTREAGVAGGRRYVRVTERTPGGAVLCETITVAGGGHGWFGGDPAGSHTERGIDASAEAVRFFGLARG